VVDLAEKTRIWDINSPKAKARARANNWVDDSDGQLAIFCS